MVILSLFEIGVLCVYFVVSGDKERLFRSISYILLVYGILTFLTYFSRINILVNSIIIHVVSELNKQWLNVPLSVILFIYIIWKVVCKFYKYEVCLMYFITAIVAFVICYTLSSKYQFIMDVIMLCFALITLLLSRNSIGKMQGQVSKIITIGIAVITLYQGVLEQAESKAADNLNTIATVSENKGKIAFYDEKNNEIKINVPEITFYPKTGFITHVFFFAPITGKNNMVKYKYSGDLNNTEILDDKQALLYNLNLPFYVRTSAFRMLSHAIYNNKSSYYYCYIMVEGENSKKQEYIVIYRIKNKKLVGRNIVFNYDDFLCKKNVGFLSETAYNEIKNGAQWVWKYVKSNNL